MIMPTLFQLFGLRYIFYCLKPVIKVTFCKYTKNNKYFISFNRFILWEEITDSAIKRRVTNQS